jgi:predicted PurR-regulated permease PerM
LEPREKATEHRSLITYGVLLAISLAVVVLIAYELLVDLELVAVALLIAVVLRSIVSAVKKIGAPSWMAPIITLVAIGGLGAFLWFILIPSFLKQAQTLASSVPGYLEGLSGLSSVLPASIAAYLPDLSNLSQSLGQRLRDVLSPVIDSLPHYISSLTEVTIGLVITVVLALYMASSRYLETFIVDSWVEHLRQHERASVAEKELQENVLSFHLGDAPPMVSHFIAGAPNAN